MNKTLRLLYQPYKWFVFFPVVIFSTLFFGILAVTLAKLVSPRTGRLVGGTIWAQVIGQLAPMQVTVRGKENIRQGQSYVVTSNHQSHFDILVVYGWMGIDPMWVMKQELRRIPAFGWICEKVGMIYIDRSDTESAIRSLAAAKEKVVNGSSVIFFPEGTRSRDGRMGRFKKGAFKMALDLGLPVLPVTILGTRDILPSDSIDLFPGQAEMTIHPPVDVAGRTADDLPELMETVRRQIESSMPEQLKG